MKSTLCHSISKKLFVPFGDVCMTKMKRQLPSGVGKEVQLQTYHLNVFDIFQQDILYQLKQVCDLDIVYIVQFRISTRGNWYGEKYHASIMLACFICFIFFLQILAIVLVLRLFIYLYYVVFMGSGMTMCHVTIRDPY